MKHIIKRILLALAVLVILVVGVVINFLVHGGAFKTIEPHFAGSCTAIGTGGPSGEDIQVDAETGIAYISAYDRRALMAGEDVRGTVLRLDLQAASPTLSPALSDVPDGFRPHGLSLFVDEDGQRTLWVINHPPAGHHTVERFEQASGGLFEHRQTIQGELLTDPNDLVAIGPRQFYLVNDSGATNGFERATEMLFARALSTLVYFDGKQLSIALRDLASPAGINIISERQQLIVGETQAQRLQVLDYSMPLALTLLETVEVGSGVDNIDVAADNALWVAAHANSLALVKHFANPGNPAPSQIFRIELNPGKPRIEEIYLNLGDEISAGSVGATYKSILLIGSITQSQILVCTLPEA